MKNKRKIIQIAIDSMVEDDLNNYYQEIWALCDDGSIWTKRWTFAGQIPEWKREKGVPQD